MAVAVVNQRALMNEAAWLPNSLDDVLTIRRLLLGCGVSRTSTDGIVAWLIAKKGGETDTTNSRTRSAYRKILARLDSPLQSPQSDAIPGLLNGMPEPAKAA